MRRLTEFARGTAALVAVAAVVVGVPAALWLAVGWPLPTALPTVDGIGEGLTSTGVDDRLVVNALAIVIWLAWVQVVVALVLEVVALVRGRATAAVPTMRAVQLGVGRLVATCALIGSALSSPRIATAPLPMPIPIVAVADEAVSVERPTPTAGLTTSPAAATYTVQRHDSLWSIAEQLLGDGLRWRELRDLNVGRLMSDGSRLDPTSDVIQPGWVLALPGDAIAPSSPTAHDAAVVVSPGESLWTIAERTAPEVLGHAPSAGELHDHWRTVIDVNRSRLADPSDPGLIFTGQVIAVPGLDSRPEAQPTATLEAVSTSEPSATTVLPLTASPPATRVGPGSVDEPTTEESQDEDAASSTVVGIAGAALAVGVVAELARRRRRRIASAPRGVAPAAPAPELDEARAELLVAADADLIERRDGALRALGVALHRSHPSVRPSVVRAAADRIEVLLSGVAVPAVAPWVAEGGGSVWTTTDDLRMVGGTDPLPTMVAIGAPDTGQLYLDLEGEGVVAVTGGRDECVALLRSFALELGARPPEQTVDLLVIDELDELGVEDVVTWDEIADDVLARAAQGRDLLAAHRWSSPFVGRTVRGIDDALRPLVVLATGVIADARFADACALVASAPTTVAVVVIGDVEDATAVQVADGLLQLPRLDLVCRAQQIDRGMAEATSALLGEIDGGQLVLLDEIESALPVTADLRERAVSAPEVLIRCLGEIDVVGGRRPLAAKQTSVLTYIALHGPVTSERIEDAVWPTATGSRRKRLANTVSECRNAIGPTSLPVAVDGRYRLGHGVGTDLDEFERLVHLAADADGQARLELLRKAVELVRGPVFTYRTGDRSSYVWIDLENWLTTWELKVVNAVLDLHACALDLDDVDTAIWAAERGLAAVPVHSGMTEALMKAYWRRGDLEAAERVYLSHAAALDDLDGDDVAESMLDLREQIRTGRSA